MDAPLVLSLFPGIGLLDRAFEEEGFCVVRGPDVLWGGDVRRFHPPAHLFQGVIGGPPCKAHSALVHIVRARYGEASVADDLIPEYERVVREAQPRWFVMENTPLAPAPRVAGYGVNGLVLNNRWLGEEQHRERRFSWGQALLHDWGGRPLDVSPDLALFEQPTFEYAVTAQRTAGAGLARDRGNTTRPAGTMARKWAAARRSFERCCELQGLPSDFLRDAPFTQTAKFEVIGNGVPLPMGRAIARAVKRAMGYALEEAAS